MAATDNEFIITECPRDAMQGMDKWIAPEAKAAYLSMLIDAGFRRIDAGSFVSAKAVPQMADTAEVLRLLPPTPHTELLVIVANARGAEEAVKHSNVTHLGFPLSVSETFQQRNTNKDIATALAELNAIHAIATAAGKATVCYLSMAWGNPYGDPYSAEVVMALAEKVMAMGIRSLSLSDTIGSSTAENTYTLLSRMMTTLPEAYWAAHLHTRSEDAHDKVKAVWESGCRRIDSAIGGYGGCPMAQDALVGNMPTEAVVGFCHQHMIESSVQTDVFRECIDRFNHLVK